MSGEEDRIKSPVLTKLGEVEVTTWAKRCEAYVKRGGSRRARDCIDDDVHEREGALFGADRRC